MKVRILADAQEDLTSGYRFYEAQSPGLGDYFINSLFSDIDSLQFFGGIHQIVSGGYHRMLSKRFPFAIYYYLDAKTVIIYAVLDCRRKPSWNRKRLYLAKTKDE